MWTLFVWILMGILLIIAFKIVFGIAPTKATTESFLKENGCNPSAIETNSDSEYPCAYYLRRHSATIFGQIIKAGFPLFATNPFGYFNYDLTFNEVGCALTNTCNNDEHTYVFVMTRDRGPLVYNPVNGDFIGTYNQLASNMGCNLKPVGSSLFFSQREKLNLHMDVTRCTMDKTMEYVEASKSYQEYQYNKLERDEYENTYGADYDSSEDPNNIYDCADFNTHAEAQAVFEAYGGIDNDVHHLDRDGDGSACETLPR